MSMRLVVNVTAAALLLVQLARILIGAARLRRRGAPHSLVSAVATAHIIGLVFTLGAAIVAGYAVSRALTPFALTSAPLLVIPVAAGLVASWVVAGVYYKWLALPIQGWFTAEEGLGHGR